MTDKFKAVSYNLNDLITGTIQLESTKPFSLKHSYFTCRTIKQKSTPIPKETDPRKLFDRVIKTMEWKNDVLYHETKEFMCDCECKCTGPCEYDRNGVCTQHTVPYEYIQRVYINPAYGLMNYKKRLEKKKERQEKLLKEKEERKKMIELETIERIMKRKELNEKIDHILDAINFLENKYR